MKHLRLLASVFALALATIVAKAAVGSTFIVNQLNYTVLTENADNATGTVSVKASNTNLWGNFDIPETVLKNEITYTVTTLAASAFRDCKSIQSISIPSTITAIPANCFYACTGLKKVTLPPSIVSIGKNAFRDCKYLAAIENFESTKVTTIDNYTFYKAGITSISLPATLAKIGTEAFSECTKLVELIGLEKTKLSSIGTRAFYKCSKLASPIAFPSTLKTIPTEAFIYCSSIPTVDLRGKITTIQRDAFAYCSSLNNVEIPSNVKTLASGVFAGCSSLESIKIPATLTSIGWHYCGDDDSFRKGVFESCTGLKNVTIEEGVKELGAKCFWLCTSLEEVTIPSSLTHLGYLMSDEQFNALPWGTSTYTHDPEKEIKTYHMGYWSGIVGHSYDKWLFSGCTNLKKVVFSDGCHITAIGNQCFDSAPLDTVTIPQTVTFIGESAFSGAQFEYIKIPDGVECIGSGAFWNCKNLRLIKLPNSIKYMKSPATYGWWTTFGEPPSTINGNYYKEYFYTDPADIYTMHDKAVTGEGGAAGAIFKGNTSQTHVTLPSFLETVGSGLIAQCPQITEITIPAYVKVGDDIVDYKIYGSAGSTPLKSIFFMGDSIPPRFERITVADSSKLTYYVKKSVFYNKYPSGMIKGQTWHPTVPKDSIARGNHKKIDYEYKVSYKVPLTMTNASGNPLIYKTMCRDFDVDLTHTNDNLPEGVEPLRAYLVEDVEGELRMVFLNEIKYIPSRLKANTIDENGNRYQGVDEYVGVILRGTPGYTYYYEIGEHDYTQGAEGQWLMEDAMQYSNSTFEQNLMAGDANDDFYVYKTVKDEEDNDIVNYGLNNNKLKIYYKNGWLTYNKAYLQLPKDVSDAIEKNTDAEGNANLTFIFSNADGSTDKVSSIEFNRNCESDIFYNPYGQRVNANTKGIVINNGKKYVSK